MSFLKKNPQILDAVESMQTMAANISSILYVPTLDTHNPPELLSTMFEEMSESNVDFVEGQYPDFKQVIESFENAKRHSYPDLLCEFISELHQKCEYPFLIEIKLCQNIYSVSHDSNGAIRGYSGVWNSYSNEWFFANSIEHALQIATERGRLNLVRHQTVLSVS
ncbi:MAG: hypothetical protein PHG15_00650 [Acinetobacter sp.]|uniref:hypothetical protein n=1 Tax=Acinetobacter sp. TaxID=472 RepID=UPI00260D38BA|nr:hypothetical protein [Acinetobacter sp.]MDD2944327.1 hypothetical protein [Acinetobacter sp.]